MPYISPRRETFQGWVDHESQLYVGSDLNKTPGNREHFSWTLVSSRCFESYPAGSDRPVLWQWRRQSCQSQSKGRATIELVRIFQRKAPSEVRPIRSCTASMCHLSCWAKDKPTQAMPKKTRRSSSSFATGLEETGDLLPRRPRLRGMGEPASLFRGGAQVGGCAKIFLGSRATAAACSSDDDTGSFVKSECR